MRKSRWLLTMPLWECENCDRLEFKQPPSFFGLDCATCGHPMKVITDTANATTRFEAVALHFYRDTGYLHPGKDVPAAMAGGGYRERQEAAFAQWNCDVPLQGEGHGEKGEEAQGAGGSSTR